MTFRLIRGRYPYDPTGKSPDNLVRGETHDIPPLTQRIITTRYGAFYKNSLIVTHKGKTLELNKDYELAGFYQEATAEVGQDVYVLIYFINEDIIGEVELTYQIVGGDFTGIWETVQSFINVLLVDPRKPRWDDIINKPQLYAPKDHFHSIDDVYGIDILIPILEEIRYAIGQVNSTTLAKVYDRLMAMDHRVDEKLAAYDNTFYEKIEKGDFAEKLELLKVNVKETKDRLAEIENDDSLSNEIKELKKKDVLLQNQLAASVDNLQNSINGLVESKLDKTAFTEKYNEILARQAALNQEISSLNNLKLDKSAFNEKYNEITAVQNALNNSINNLSNSLNQNIRDASDSLDNRINTLSGNVNSLTENKLDKTTFQTSYDDLVRRLNAKPDQAGLTCDSIGRLPAVPWERGISLLAKKANGDCVRLQPSENFFQDIGVSISANRTSIEGTGTFNVKYIVTNSGVATNEMTELTITLPRQNQTTPYTITNRREVLQSGTRFEKVNDNLYRIYGLSQGGTFTLTFDLTARTHGTYQLGGQVSVSQQWDTNSQNNSSSLILSSLMPVSLNNENYVVSQNCPLARLVYVPENRVMRQVQSVRENDRNRTVEMSHLSALTNLNLIRPTVGLKSLRFKLTGVSTVVIIPKHQNMSDTTVIRNNQNKFFENAQSNIARGFNADAYGFRDYRAALTSLEASDSKISDFNNYTFNPSTGDLVINTNFELVNGQIWPAAPDYATGYLIYCRANGNNCMWQLYYVGLEFMLNTRATNYVVNGLASNLYLIETKKVTHPISKPIQEASGAVVGYEIYNYTMRSCLNKAIITEKKITINLPKNKEYNFTITYTDAVVKKGVFKGNINVSHPEDNKVAVSVKRAATSTDNVDLGDIKINII